MDRKTLLHLEELARLKLSDSERERLLNETEDIIKYFNTLTKLDTNGVEPLSHAFETVNVLREDTALPSLPQEEILQNAVSENGLFAVPSSVENADKEAEDD